MSGSRYRKFVQTNVSRRRFHSLILIPGGSFIIIRSPVILYIVLGFTLVIPIIIAIILIHRLDAFGKSRTPKATLTRAIKRISEADNASEKGLEDSPQRHPKSSKAGPEHGSNEW